MPTVSIPVKEGAIHAELTVPSAAKCLVIFAHGSGSSRLSRRNQYVAKILNEGDLATLLIDLLTLKEESVDNQTAEHRFNIDLLARRLTAATEWAGKSKELKNLPVGYFGASTGAAAALVAASQCPDVIRAIVSRGGRPDLAGGALEKVNAPTLLIVGELDQEVLELNRLAAARIPGPKEIRIVPRATHLFEEPGALEQVALLAREWFAAKIIGL